jgi:hypothetical protein
MSGGYRAGSRGQGSARRLGRVTGERRAVFAVAAPVAAAAAVVVAAAAAVVVVVVAAVVAAVAVAAVVERPVRQAVERRRVGE